MRGRVLKAFSVRKEEDHGASRRIAGGRGAGPLGASDRWHPGVSGAPGSADDLARRRDHPPQPNWVGDALAGRLVRLDVAHPPVEGPARTGDLEGAVGRPGRVEEADLDPRSRLGRGGAGGESQGRAGGTCPDRWSPACPGVCRAEVMVRTRAPDPDT